MEWDEAQHLPLKVIKQAGLNLACSERPILKSTAVPGFSYVDYTINIIEELAAVESGIALAVAAHNSLCSGHIYLAGSEEQAAALSCPSSPAASGSAAGR